jgi:hypothetical protein
MVKSWTGNPKMDQTCRVVINPFVGNYRMDHHTRFIPCNLLAGADRLTVTLEFESPSRFIKKNHCYECNSKKTCSFYGPLSLPIKRAFEIWPSLAHFHSSPMLLSNARRRIGLAPTEASWATWALTRIAPLQKLMVAALLEWWLPFEALWNIVERSPASWGQRLDYSP